MNEPLDLEAIRERAIYYRNEQWVDELYGEFAALIAEVERLRELAWWHEEQGRKAYDAAIERAEAAAEAAEALIEDLKQKTGLEGKAWDAFKDWAAQQLDLEAAEAEVKTLREGINEFLASVQGGDNGLAVYRRLESLATTDEVQS